MRRRLPWLTLGLWVTTAVAGMLAIPGALDDRSTIVVAVVAVECWVVWGAAWLAMLVPRALSLTVARVLVPTAIAAALITALQGASLWAGVAFIVTSLVTTASLVHGSTTDAFVDGSSYGAERRFALRVPPMLALTAVPIAWLIAVAGLAVPPLSAARAWAPGAVALLLALVPARFALRSLHQLSRRWIVFVPAGMVIHDPLVIADAVLLPRRTVVALGPALAETDATDLSGGALGLALQVDVEEPIGISLVNGPRRAPTEVSTGRLVFTPLRPGALLGEADERRLRIATPAAMAPDLPACATDGHGHAPTTPDEAQTAVPLPSTRSPR